MVFFFCVYSLISIVKMLLFAYIVVLPGLSWLSVHGFLSLTIILIYKMEFWIRGNKVTNPIKTVSVSLCVFSCIYVCIYYLPRTFSSEISIISETKNGKIYSNTVRCNTTNGLDFCLVSSLSPHLPKLKFL